MIPPPAREILELIRVTETKRKDESAYDTIFGHNEHKLPKPITTITVDELIRAQPGFTKSYGSSASGAYQFMLATMKDLKKSLNLTGHELMNAEQQDRLGLQLLLRRGYQAWAEGRASSDTFMVALAKEWASFPVPSRMKGAHRVVQRGETYYAGDKLNKALITPDKVWLALEAARTATDEVEEPAEPIAKPEVPGDPVEEVTLSKTEWAYALRTIAAAMSDPAKRERILALLAESGGDDDGA